MRGSLAGLLLVYSAISPPATGFVMHEISRCSCGDDKEGNGTYQYVFAFNHQYILEYDSEINMFVPFQSVSKMMDAVGNFTTEFNNDPDMFNYVKSEEEKCKNEIKTFWNNTVQRRVRPSMEVFFPEGKKDSLPVLICFVWGFYPDNIIVSWIKNNKTVIKTENRAMQIGDWTYQLVSQLDLRDSVPEDNYTCKVDHPSLDEPMTKTWKAGLTSIQIIKISVSSVIFALGLITVIAGVMCWKNAKRSDDCHFVATIFRPWHHIFAPCFPIPLVSLSREGSITNDSASSLISCQSQSLMDEERDLGEDSEAGSMDGQLIVG